MGLFGKSKRELLEWQNLITDSPSNRLYMNEKQLKAASVIVGNRLIEIVNDSGKLIETTTNIDTFFSRYDLYLEDLEKLSKLEKFVHMEGKSPSKKLLEIRQDYASTLQEFIDRYWKATLRKADNLKTQKGKQNQYQKLANSFDSYSQRIPDSIKKYISNLMNEV